MDEDIRKALEEGVTFEEMKDICRRILEGDGSLMDLRIVYGTRTERWYLIDKNDRDYDVWGIEIEDFCKFKNEDIALELALKPRMWVRGVNRKSGLISVAKKLIRLAEEMLNENLEIEKEFVSKKAVSSYGEAFEKARKQGYPAYFDGDLICNVCGEPWNARSIEEDMGYVWARKFREGKGCPSCKGVEPE